MHIWFKSQNYGILEFIVFLETKKYTDKPKFGKVLNKKARRARTQKNSWNGRRWTYCIFNVLRKDGGTDVRTCTCITKPPSKFNENNMTLLLSFVPRSSTDLYLPVRYSAKVLHIVHELCENAIRLGTSYKMYQTQ